MFTALKFALSQLCTFGHTTMQEVQSFLLFQVRFIDLNSACDTVRIRFEPGLYSGLWLQIHLRQPSFDALFITILVLQKSLDYIKVSITSSYCSGWRHQHCTKLLTFVYLVSDHGHSMKVHYLSSSSPFVFTGALLQKLPVMSRTN